MWKINKPPIKALDCFDICIAGIRDTDLSNRLEGIRGKITESENAFEVFASAVDLHLMNSSTHVDNSVTAKEMKNLYERHMARDGSRGYDIYDAIMLAATDERCPFCGHRSVSTLDHCLPKAQHPSLSVTPINLIPSCKDCNHSKGNQELIGKSDQFLNAYYDDVTTQVWLDAKIVESSPAGIRFFVTHPGAWDAITSARVNNHFNKLELSKLYASQGGRHLRNIRRSIKKFFDAGGHEAVREDLWCRHGSHSEVEINAWEAALYKAAAESDWYCSGGFNA